MLYRLIIVDDEPIISESLKKIFNWNEMGFEIAGTFDDGESVIKYIEENDVDVVLSDIRMNNVSGIDIAKYIHENSLSVKVVLMSAYQEFEYAKEAIKYNVENYILKPISPKEIREIFFSMKKSLDKEKNNIDKKDAEEQIDYISAIIKRQFLTDCFQGTIKNNELIDRQLKFLGLDIDVNNKVCKEVHVEIKNYNDFAKKDSIYTMYNEIERTLNDIDGKARLYTVDFVRNYIYVLAAFESHEDEKIADEEIMSLLADKIFKILCDMNIDLSVERIGKFKCFADIRFYNKNIDMMFNNELFMSYINECNREKAYMYFLNTIEGLYISSIDSIKEYVNKWYDTIMIERQNHKISSVSYKDEEFRERIKNAAGREEINEEILKMINRLINSIENQDIKYYNGIISEAIEYMSQNVHKHITLEDVAKQVYLNPVYFSRLFKEKTGINFLEYYTRLKIERAKELLSQGKYKIYEIGEMIGYSSNQHFRRIFKEYTGFTPIEYKNALGENNEE